MLPAKDKMEQLRWLQEMEIEYYLSDKPASSPDKNSAISNEPAQNKVTSTDNKQPANIISSVREPTSPVELARYKAGMARDLQELKEQLLSFNGCNLKNFARTTVFGDGNANARIMFIGEAPGASEDAAGIPFCGESGKLLDKMLACIGLLRQENFYITNTVFWRPPANRQPTQEEIDICRPFVEKHIALIMPKLIILVGSTAATGLLGKHAGITKIRQEYYNYTNQYLTSPIPVTAIFHPAYLLRQPTQKKTAWHDLLKIQQFINEKLQ